MIRFAYSAWCVLLAAIAAATLVPSEHPPHAAPPVAAVPQYAGEVFPDLLGQVEAFVGWVEGVRRGEAEEAARVEAARVEAARVAAARQPASSSVVRAGGPPDCDGFPDWFPHAIIWRESNCRRGLSTGNGYFGAYQVAAFHWAAGGACEDLTWTIPEQEDECTDRLSQHGTRLSPWGY